jgi:hypothetical protein
MVDASVLETMLETSHLALDGASRPDHLPKPGGCPGGFCSGGQDLPIIPVPQQLPRTEQGLSPAGEIEATPAGSSTLRVESVTAYVRPVLPSIEHPPR